MIKKEISSMLLTSAPYPFLLPGVCIAEVLGFSQPFTDREVPPWYLGEVGWRGEVLPTISLEIMRGGEMSAVDKETRLVVLNGHLGAEDLHFYAVVTPFIPKLIRVMESQITRTTDDSGLEYTKMQVSLFGEKAVVPDLAAIEAELLPWTI